MYRYGTVGTYLPTRIVKNHGKTSMDETGDPGGNSKTEETLAAGERGPCNRGRYWILDR